MILLDPNVYLWIIAAALAVLTLVLVLLCRNKRRKRLRRITPLVVLLAWEPSTTVPLWSPSS